MHRTDLKEPPTASSSPKPRITAGWKCQKSPHHGVSRSSGGGSSRVASSKLRSRTRRYPPSKVWRWEAVLSLNIVHLVPLGRSYLSGRPWRIIVYRTTALSSSTSTSAWHFGHVTNSSSPMAFLSTSKLSRHSGHLSIDRSIGYSPFGVGYHLFRADSSPHTRSPSRLRPLA